jgi:hypothetical protein
MSGTQEDSMTDEQWGARPVSMSNSDYYWGPNTNEGWSYQPLGPEWIATSVPSLVGL